MHCAECGAELEDRARFCDQCGNEIAAGIGLASDGRSEARRATRIKKLSLALALLAVVAMLVTIRLAPRASSPLPRVPDVVGKRLGDAEAELRRIGLTCYVRDERFSDADRQGTVVGQAPEEGHRAPSDRRIAVMLGLGPGVVVPNLTGLTVAEANTALGKIGLHAHLESRESGAYVREGVVSASEPPPGERVRAGASVALMTAAEIENPTVPDVLGMDGEQAKSLLRSHGLEYEIGARSFSGSVPRGYVMWQRPQGGDPLPSDREVRVVLSLGRGVQIPDVVGKSEKEARTALARAGIAVRVNRQHAPAPAGRVVGSTPGPGHKVPVGGTVTLRVSKGPGGDGFLRVEVEPRDWEVWLYVDGGDTRGRCPLTVRLTAGRHAVILWAPRQQKREEFAIEVASNQTVTVRRSLR